VSDPIQGESVASLGLATPRLEDLVDRDALRDMATSFERLTRLPIRFVSAGGALLAEAGAPATICGLVGETTSGRHACGEVVDEVKRRGQRATETIDHPCFTGARYRVVPLVYDGALLGRAVLGPFRAAVSAPDAPAPLFAIAPTLDGARAAAAIVELPALDDDALARVEEHLRSVLGLILWSGHKALLTSTMHIASVRESFRTLSEKNAALEDAFQRLKELDRLKSNFLATVSHELRTPLTSIMGYGEMLAEGIGGPLTAEQAEFVQTIQQKSEQLLSLIMSLLDLSKLESGTVAVRRAEIELRTLLADAGTTLLPAATRKGVSLSWSVESGTPPVFADAQRLRLVLVNLTDNAIKFTPSGGTVSLGARLVLAPADDEPGLVLVAPVRQSVEIRVADTGPGVPEAERERIFDPFYQVDQSSTREYGGAGLGLAIVKRLVDAHFGTIHVEAGSPRGAVFVVRLPLVRASSLPGVDDGAPLAFEIEPPR
jgi:signal transduction histidine kinase